MTETRIRTAARPVFKLHPDDSNIIMAYYESLSEAARQNNTYQSAIRRACDREASGSSKGSAGGFRWAWGLAETFEEKQE